MKSIIFSEVLTSGKYYENGWIFYKIHLFENKKYISSFRISHGKLKEISLKPL